MMPVYLSSIGYSAIFIGVLEGFAEAIAGISKAYFGRLSDFMNNRVKFVRLGYLLSAISKPILAFFTNGLMIFTARATDRIGKGLRTAPRDALLIAECKPADRGKIFGFHRGLDTTGAFIGPLIAIGFLFYFPGEYQSLFLIAFIPALIAVILGIFIRERKSRALENVERKPFMIFLKEASPNYKLILGGLVFFALFNSSDAFLLLMLRKYGFDEKEVIGLYVFYNIVFALASFPFGKIGDKRGLLPMIIAGLFVFSSVYFLMSIEGSILFFLFVFLMYGIYAAIVESSSKAILSLHIKKEDKGTAMGLYASLISLGALFASVVAGIFWETLGPVFVFYYGCTGALITALFFMFVFSRINSQNKI